MFNLSSKTCHTVSKPLHTRSTSRVQTMLRPNLAISTQIWSHCCRHLISNSTSTQSSHTMTQTILGPHRLHIRSGKQHHHHPHHHRHLILLLPVLLRHDAWFVVKTATFDQEYGVDVGDAAVLVVKRGAGLTDHMHILLWFRFWTDRCCPTECPKGSIDLPYGFPSFYLYLCVYYYYYFRRCQIPVLHSVWQDWGFADGFCPTTYKRYFFFFGQVGILW